MKSFWGTSITLLILKIFMTSCQPNLGVEVAPKYLQTVKVQNGRLVFSDNMQFRNTLLHLKNESDLNAWERGFEGFVSMRASYSRLSQKLADQDIDQSQMVAYSELLRSVSDREGIAYGRAINDDWLAGIVNEKGIVQIGDSVYKITSDWVKVVHFQYENELNKPSSRVIVRAVKKIGKQMAQTTARIAYDDYQYKDYSFDGRRHRFVSNHWCEVYPLPYVYWSTGLRVEHQRKQTFGWGWSNAFNWNATYNWQYFAGSSSPFRQDQSSSSFGETDTALFYRYSEPTYPSIPDYRVTSLTSWTATGRDGQSYGISNLAFDVNLR
jgi:hypothetical protein